ncbi:MAG: cystathionine gamma-synthase family protein [Thermoprotei archaeon]|nr:MAG: cystathionine gamma-synthase family protein [Thermoprotei archaeon]
MGLRTDSIHAHEYFDRTTGAFIPPIYQIAMFEQPGWTRTTDRGTDLKYSREENPTVRALEKLLARLELAEDALCFSSGMATVATVYFSLLKRGDVVVIPMELYGTSLQLALELRKYGVEVLLSWPETDKIIDIVNRKVKLVFIETMTNPMLRVIDVPELAKVCRDLGVVLVVDNTFVTPVLYQPMRDHVDMVIHSMTKYIAGHNDVVAGVLAGSKKRVIEVWDWRRKLGNILAPFEAYLVLRGVKTLGIRMKTHCENAQAIAEFLRDHPKVKEVYYPGLSDDRYHSIAKRVFKNGYGGVVSFKVRGGKEEVLKILRELSIIKAAPSLGGPESLISYPIISAAKVIPDDIREKLGITEELLRLSVGLEDVDDLIEDLDNALKKI